MIPARSVTGRTIAVLGLGRSGLAVARSLQAGGAKVLAWDDGAEARAKAEAAGFDTEDLSRLRDWQGIDSLIVSPGIPHLYPEPNRIIAAAMAAGVAVDNDIGVFFRSYATPDWDRFDTAPRVVAVTGSNGKSTTSALIHHVVAATGRPAQLGGNIGRGVMGLDPAQDGEVCTLELSSYQTDLARALTPDIAVFLNLTPDHLDRHGGIGGYFAAKARLFTAGGPDRAIIGVDEKEGVYLANQIGGVEPDRVIQVSVARKLQEAHWSVFARKGFLAEWRKGRQVASVDLRGIASLRGAHNHQNACAAYAVGRALGIGPREIETALATFEGLPHRSQVVGSRDGVTFVNDSKATNADSAAQALRAYDNIRWIAGGLGKDGGIAALAADLGHVRKAYLIGHSARAFALQVTGIDTEICETMARAVARAAEDAEAGDTVLLAPAAASFDQYSDFEARGADFIACAKAWLDR